MWLTYYSGDDDVLSNINPFGYFTPVSNQKYQAIRITKNFKFRDSRRRMESEKERHDRKKLFCLQSYGK